ncbi:zinc transporter ZupT [candidate division KSB1 bacterium]|nr:zinc transporter ZupT [candidate division KSB1 bacterium]
MPQENVTFAFLLTLFAGLSTGFGSLIAFVARTTRTQFLSLALGFSAGVMIYVSLIEIFAKARIALSSAYGDARGYWVTTIAFFGGMAIVFIIDQLVPSFENPHEPRMVEEMGKSTSDIKKMELQRMGLFSALAIAIHNFPEGLATFSSALTDPALGVSIAFAIAIHNIPEGIAVSVPLYYATGSKKKAFGLSFLSGLSEPLGALIGYFLLRPFFSEAIFGILFASVAGIMVYISLDELLPAAEKYGEHHLAISGVLSGMVVIALSLLAFV